MQKILHKFDVNFLVVLLNPGKKKITLLLTQVNFINQIHSKEKK